MFTGIIESIGRIQDIKETNSNKTFWINSPISKELKVDQSISHNGVCLTVEEINGNTHTVTAIEETLLKSNLNNSIIGDEVNLERCMVLNGRLDGHIVQGHVDATAICIDKKDLNGSWIFRFTIPQEYAKFVIEKGSVAINGISLTLINVSINEFSVAIIPYTYSYTNMKSVNINTVVNVEFDVIGKYIERILSVREKA